VSVDSEKKVCSQCGATKNAETEFGLNASAPDGRRSVCNSCRRDNRRAASTKDAQELKAHNKTVAEAQKRLLHPETLTPGELKKLSDVVRLADKHREVLQSKVQAAHAEQEAAQKLAAAGPSLALVKEQFGSIIFLTTEGMRAKLVLARNTLCNLVGPDDALAVQHVEKYIERVDFIVKQRDSQAAEMAADAQETLNEKVCRRVIGRVHDQYLGQIRAANTVEAKVALREKIRARKKALLAMAKTATGKDKNGAERAVVAKAVADALEKLALMCYGAKAELPSDSLENLQSRIDSANAVQEELEKIEAERRQYWEELHERDPKQFERESKSLVLQLKGTGPFVDIQRKSMQQLKREDPAEYERRALEALRPRKVTQDAIIYVAMDGKREIWMWPDGRLVKKGEEVTYDTRLKRYCLMPGPAGVELDAVTATGRQKQELVQHDDGTFHWVAEGSQGTWSQQNDGTWKQDAGSGVSPWTRPEKIVFRRVEPPASAAHTEMRHGRYWTPEEVKAAEAADAANPPQLLPPLPRHAVADSLALPPPISAADRAKDSRVPYVWARHEQAEKERKAKEAELLRGN
jgi:hypothetical protein